MNYKIFRAAVIGSGTMGAAIAAHLANAGVPVILLDIVPRKLTPDQEKRKLTLESSEVRNSIVNSGLDRAIKSRPASFASDERAALVTTGNLEDDFDLLRGVDWVIEVIVENLAIKRQLMERIEAIRGEHTIVSSNTSGIPIAAIGEGRSTGFRQHFLGTHFFNPPRYLKLIEVIPTADTLPEVVDFISDFCAVRLGKGVVPCKDTPNFIGNRLAFGSGAFALDYIVRNGYTVEEVDAVTGPLIGRPKTATFRLIDLVGVDVWEHVGSNLVDAIPHDRFAQPFLKSEPVNQLIHTLVNRGWLGNKTEAGFYKPVRVNGKKDFWPLNLQTLEHQEPQSVRFESVGKARKIEDLGERLKVMLESEDRAAELVRALTYQGFAYAASCIPEIADSPLPIDNAMRWGFGHEAGPFEIWDRLGLVETAEKMNAAGFVIPEWVNEMIAAGFNEFYRFVDNRLVGVFNPHLRDYEAVETSPLEITVRDLKAAGKTLQRNPGASLFDLGDGVAYIDFHSKLNILNDDVLRMLSIALDKVESGPYTGLVIGSEGENFSAGADLGFVLLASHMGMWDQLEGAITALQNLHMRIRYFPRPVVVAPAGLALGGGAEMIMHATRVVAGLELYTGLVEMGVGVIPAGGGTKELLRRVLNPAMRTKNADPLAYLQRIFEQIGLAKVATSGEEARQMGILAACDRVVLNRGYLLAEAKKEALHMSEGGYTPPLPEKIYAAGRDALAALRVAIFMLRKGKQISEYDALMAEKLSYVMTGGELSAAEWVSEQYILDLEKEAFLYLCGQENTRARMKHMLDTGKPLRN